MTSLSYCMFENTATELNQVVYAMQTADSWEDLDLNEYELRAKERLFRLCRNYIEAYSNLSELEESESEEV